MRNAEAGQQFGNQQEIRRLNDALYRKYVMPMLENPPATLSHYRADHPEVTHISLIHRVDMAKGEWQVNRVGTFTDVIPDVTDPDVNRWTKLVDSFDSSEAVQHGKTADAITPLESRYFKSFKPRVREDT